MPKSKSEALKRKVAGRMRGTVNLKKVSKLFSEYGEKTPASFTSGDFLKKLGKHLK